RRARRPLELGAPGHAEGRLDFSRLAQHLQIERDRRLVARGPRVVVRERRALVAAVLERLLELQAELADAADERRAQPRDRRLEAHSERLDAARRQRLLERRAAREPELRPDLAAPRDVREPHAERLRDLAVRGAAQARDDL